MEKDDEDEEDEDDAMGNIDSLMKKIDAGSNLGFGNLDDPDSDSPEEK
jgi:hypothetical protein